MGFKHKIKFVFTSFTQLSKNKPFQPIIQYFYAALIVFIGLTQIQNSWALSAPSPPEMRVTLFNTIGAQPFTINNTNESYVFSGWLEWPNQIFPFQNGVDLYFGQFFAHAGEQSIPQAETVWTWTHSNNQAVLNPGLVPIAVDTKAETYNTGNDFSYQFSGTEPKGMYIQFLIIVPTGLAPSNPDHWYYIETRPFFFVD